VQRGYLALLVVCMCNAAPAAMCGCVVTLGACLVLILPGAIRWFVVNCTALRVEPWLCGYAGGMLGVDSSWCN
jgi:hypothetical protein